MRKTRMTVSGAMALVVALAGGAGAMAQDGTQDRDQTYVYGSQLMTQQERLRYSERMRSLKTDQERDAYRLEHHQLMQQRARDRGVVLPDEPRMAPGQPSGRGGDGAGPGAGGGAGRSGR